MNGLRRTAWWLFAAGLTIGTFADERVIDLPRRHNGRWILTADLHVHSFFGDGALPPWDIRREAERRGLDVIAITNHNQLATSRFGAWLASRSPGPLLLPAEEVTAPRYHLSVVGIARLVDWRQPLPDLIDGVHAQGGAVIGAHIAEPGTAAYESPDVLRRLDGLEGPPPVVWPDDDRAAHIAAFFTRAGEIHPHIAIIGGSDFHFLAPLGGYRTYLLAKERTAAGVVEALRQGQTVACDTRGRVNGDRELMTIVEADCVAAAAGAHRPGRWARLGSYCAWLALAAIVIVTGSAREA